MFNLELIHTSNEPTRFLLVPSDLFSNQPLRVIELVELFGNSVNTVSDV